MHGNSSLRVDPRPSWSQRVSVLGYKKRKSDPAEQEVEYEVEYGFKQEVNVLELII